MQLAFGWSSLLGIVLAVFFLVFGIRDLKGKDPLLNLPFNQYNRDPVYRAFWQKKNGVWEICNAVCFCCIQLLSRHPVLCNWLYTAIFILDIIYIILYKVWEHSAD